MSRQGQFLVFTEKYGLLTTQNGTQQVDFSSFLKCMSFFPLSQVIFFYTYMEIIENLLHDVNGVPNPVEPRLFVDGNLVNDPNDPAGKGTISLIQKYASDLSNAAIEIPRRCLVYDHEGRHITIDELIMLVQRIHQ